jgi:glycine/D-amino acid oxidase-like deaminating enzyme
MSSPAPPPCARRWTEGPRGLAWPTTPPSAADRAAYAEAIVRPFWLDRLPARQPGPPLSELAEADLCIVGGGLTGLWAAIHAKTRQPDRDVILLEGETVGFGASGRNGGFAIASLTHGLENGRARFEDELETIERLARDNFGGMVSDLERLGIDCDLEVTGELTVALEPHQVPWMSEAAELMRAYGHDAEMLDRDAVRSQVASPTYLGGVWDRSDAGLLDPGKLTAGLADAAIRLGVRIYEHTHVRRLARSGAGVAIDCEGGTVQARRALLATSAYPPLLREIRRRVLPVYDYALISEPLDPTRLESIGWRRRQALTDPGNRFHYYRLTADNRILWGGYDAIYRYGGPVGDHLDDHEPSFAGLAQRFFTTFPQLEGLRFTHRWGGAIDTCSRFSVFFDTALDGRIAYALGYTGLGVVASRFGASVALDLADGVDSEATRLRYVRTRPAPFPPEPLRSAIVGLTQRGLAAADRHQGRRGPWLRLLDRLGLGFDS